MECFRLFWLIFIHFLKKKHKGTFNFQKIKPGMAASVNFELIVITGSCVSTNFVLDTIVLNITA